IDEAEQLCDQLNQIKPDHPKLLNFMANIAYKKGDLVACEKYFSQALKQDPENENLTFNYASVYLSAHYYKKAEKILRRLYHRNPNDPKIILSLFSAVIGRNVPDIEELKQKVDRLCKKDHLLFSTLAMYVRSKGEYHQAIEYYNQAQESGDDSLLLFYNRAFPLFLAGRFEEAWQGYEHRWESAMLKLHKQDLPYPMWQGENLSGKKILIWGEQGVGDEVRFSRFLSLLPQDTTIYLTCDKRLEDIFERSFKVQLLKGKRHDLKKGIESLNVDYHLPIGSLAYRLQAWNRPLPTTAALKANSDRVHFYQQHLRQLFPGKLLVAIAWQSNRETRLSRNFEIEDLINHLRHPKIQLINFQHSITKQQLETMNKALDCDIYALETLNLYDDLDGLAALSKAVDFVVSSAQSSANIAGGVGANVLLLAGLRPEWFWTPALGLK
ncbi:MAG: tetratricopeptide repeat protein, partial [Pseudomonadota bacterium]